MGYHSYFFKINVSSLTHLFNIIIKKYTTDKGRKARKKEVRSQTYKAERKMQKTIPFAKLLVHLRPNLWFLTYQ